MTEVRRRKKQVTKAAVLEALNDMSGDRHPRNQTLIGRFMRCKEWQHANHILINALSAGMHRGTPLSEPPGSQPPPS